MAGPVDEQPKGKVKLTECSNCGRSFAKDRIDTHTSICKNQKARQVFNTTLQRVQGTEAGELVKAGKLKLEAPRPNEKKSVLTEKLNATLTKDVLPPIQASKGKENENGKTGDPAKRSVTAYQVVFDDNDKMKTKKNSKFPSAVPPPLTGKAGGKRLPSTKVDIDDRFLSAERARGNWQSAAFKARPGLSASLSGLIDNDEDDFLNSSQKTVCSDAFDFLFDSQNLNPEKVLNHNEIEHYTEEKMKEINQQALDKNLVKDSQCCIIS